MFESQTGSFSFSNDHCFSAGGSCIIADCGHILQMCLEQVLPTAPPSNQFATSKDVVCFNMF